MILPRIVFSLAEDGYHIISHPFFCYRGRKETRTCTYGSPSCRRPRIQKPFVEKADTMTEPKVPSVAAKRDARLRPQDRVRIILAEGEVSKISIQYPIKKPGIKESVY